jgi:adenylate cyclase
VISVHRGRIANIAGDSVLAEFGSAVDAVQCAVEAQAALAEANVDLSPNRHINFRIGVTVSEKTLSPRKTARRRAHASEKDGFGREVE